MTYYRKIVLIIISLTVSVFLFCSCNKDNDDQLNNEESQSQSTSCAIIDSGETTQSSIISREAISENDIDDEFYTLKDLFTYYYSDYMDWQTYKDHVGYKPSIPAFNKNNRLLAFVDETEWEEGNHVFLFDTDKKEFQMILDYSAGTEPQVCAKGVAWYDDNTLLIIIGPTYGTVTKGGDLYQYNIHNKELSIAYEAPESFEVNAINYVKKDKIGIRIVEHKNDYTEYQYEDWVIRFDGDDKNDE